MREQWKQFDREPFSASTQIPKSCQFCPSLRSSRSLKPFARIQRDGAKRRIREDVRRFWCIYESSRRTM